MSGITLQAEVVSADVKRAIAEFVAFGQETGVMMADIAAYGESSTRLRFRTQTAPDGTPWKKSKRAERTGGRTLTGRGHLGDSITNAHDRDTAAWGTNVIYAAIHNFGGEIHKAAQSRMVRHRTNARGQLLTSHDARLKGGLKGNALVFAKNSHRRAITRWFEQGEHTIRMPKRQFLGLSTADEYSILGIVQRHLEAIGHAR